MSLVNWFSRQFFHHQSLVGYLEPIVQCFKPGWRSGYYRAKVLALKEIAHDVLAIELQTQATWPAYLAGQHIELTFEINGSLKTRIFTIASSPNQAMHEGVIRLVIKSQKNGAFTPFLNDLCVNTWVNISKAKGEFTLPQEPVTMFAAGSGITPFIAMLHQALHDGCQPIHLVYYAKADQHLLVAELQSIAKRLPHFSFELLTRSQNGSVGEHLLRFEDTSFMVCGPSDFYQEIAAFAKQRNISCYSEHFSLMPLQDDAENAKMFNVNHNGIKFNASNQTPLLGQFQQQKINVSYGCGMGICHQCQCVKKKGIVKNIRTGQLSDYGEELIQLCVSQVMSDVELEA
jgi:ferredoxin-NADP reductase